MNKCIRMGITASNLSFGEVNRRFYGRKLRFTAPLTRRRKTKFPTVKPPIYLPKCQIWMQLSPNYISFPYESLGRLWYIWKWSSAHVYARGHKQHCKLHYCLWRVSIKQNSKSDWGQTWWEALGPQEDLELLKSFCSDIQDGCHVSHFENLQTTFPPAILKVFNCRLLKSFSLAILKVLKQHRLPNSKSEGMSSIANFITAYEESQ